MSILSHRGYSIPLKGLDNKSLEMYKKELTIVPYVEKPEYGTNIEPIKIYTQTEQRFYGPRYWGLKRFGTPDNDKLASTTPQPINISFNAQLRPHQIPVANVALEAFKTKGGGILALKCGFGKTALGIYLSSMLKVKTLVVSHTTSLMQQWVERIQQFSPNSKIGIIQQSKADIEGKDIVIASLKTLALKDFPKDFFDHFGLVIYDEVHLMATQLFSRAFPKCATKYALGLSATPFRKDRCDIIFQYYIGPILYTTKHDKDDAIVAQCITMMIPEDELHIKYNHKGEVLYTPSVINVVNNTKRTDRIVELIMEHAKKGRKILVLGEYISHLKDILKKLAKREQEEYIQSCVDKAREGLNIVDGWFIPAELQHDILKYISNSVVGVDEGLFTYGLYIGEMKNDARKISEQKDVILGTYKLASVGMDIPKLNTLLMASPRKDIEQSVGRILRKDTKSGGDSHNPLIIDIIDNHGIFAGQSRARKQFYKEYGYTVEHIKMDPISGKTISKRAKITKDKDVTVTMDLGSFSTTNQPLTNSVLGGVSKITNTKNTNTKVTNTKNTNVKVVSEDAFNECLLSDSE